MHGHRTYLLGAAVAGHLVLLPRYTGHEVEPDLAAAAGAVAVAATALPSEWRMAAVVVLLLFA
jgi:hypothetical protein